MTADPQKIVEGKARLAEIDLVLAHLTKRRKMLSDWLVKQGQTALVSKNDINTREVYGQDFERLWGLYPARNGMKVEKKAAFQKFKAVKPQDYPALEKAIKNYSRSAEVKRGAVRDMVRFLKPEFWPMWLNPSPAAMQPAATKKESVSKAVDEVLNAKR